jgi:hypothetical protein
MLKEIFHILLGTTDKLDFNNLRINQKCNLFQNGTSSK